MTAIPLLVPPASGVLSRAWVTNAMFRAYPTWLDTGDLIQGAQQSAQDGALADVLLAASDWAVGELDDMPLHGHYVQGEQLRTRAGGAGRLYLQPRNVPLRAVTALSVGPAPSMLSSVDLTSASLWVEQGREVSFIPYGGLNFTGPGIQFGPAPRPEALAYVDWSYVAGYPFALLPSGVTAGATSVTVDDPTSILPGDTLRIYDPVAGNEALTVAASYVPQVPTTPPTATAVPLAAPVQFTHVAGTGITGFPRRALQAVIAYAVGLLMREDVSSEEPASGFGPDARSTGSERGGQASGLVNDAYGWLTAFKPTWRS